MTTKKDQEDLQALELRKVKALEKIANSLDSLTIWFEEIDKDEWSERIQFYLAEYLASFTKSEDSVEALLDKKKKNG